MDKQILHKLNRLNKFKKEGEPKKTRQLSSLVDMKLFITRNQMLYYPNLLFWIYHLL